jgi:hypothetical protein
MRIQPEHRNMLDLAISENIDPRSKTIALTNHGRTMRASNWPQDCEFQLVAFTPSARTCRVVWAGEIAEDIGTALKALDQAGIVARGKPDWYRRLARYAQGSAPA